MFCHFVSRSTNFDEFFQRDIWPSRCNTWPTLFLRLFRRSPSQVSLMLFTLKRDCYVTQSRTFGGPSRQKVKQTLSEKTFTKNSEEPANTSSQRNKVTIDNIKMYKKFPRKNQSSVLLFWRQAQWQLIVCVNSIKSMHYIMFSSPAYGPSRILRCCVTSNRAYTRNFPNDSS